MESPDISAIVADETAEGISSIAAMSAMSSEDADFGNSESLLAGISPIVDDTDGTAAATSASQNINTNTEEESQSLLANIGSESDAINNGSESVENTAGEEMSEDDKITGDEGERNNELIAEGMDEDHSDDVGLRESETVQEVDNTNQEEMDTEDVADEDNEDTENTGPVISFPFGRIKKLMKICLNTNPEEDEEVVEAAAATKDKKAARKSGKGSKKSIAPKNGSTANYIVSKDAIYLTAVATEFFVSSMAQQASRIAIGSKKKNVTLDHLKRALNNNPEGYEFLQGCFQPSILIGD